MLVPRSGMALGLIVTALALWGCSREAGSGRSGRDTSDEPIAPVEVVRVERRSLDLLRTFSGALEAASKFVVAPKIGGRIERIAVDLADRVQRGEAVAFLEEDEFAQAVKQAEAEVAVTRANSKQAEYALSLSRRENERILTLRERGIASDSEFDLAQADLMQKQAQVAVAEAEVNRASAVLESARIRHGYTRVTADWSEGDAERRVGERYVDEGETVSANQPLLLIVQLDPIVAVVSVTERDYGSLGAGLEAALRTDAFPGEVFQGRIERIAPVFRETSRQARVELALPNPEGRLKPGMFVRATLSLDRVENAVAVPESALTQRSEVLGVFRLEDSSNRVQWVPVETGIRSQGWVHVVQPALTGRVVTLGQHLIDDGSQVRIVEKPVLGSAP